MESSSTLNTRPKFIPNLVRRVLNATMNIIFCSRYSNAMRFMSFCVYFVMFLFLSDGKLRWGILTHLRFLICSNVPLPNVCEWSKERLNVIKNLLESPLKCSKFPLRGDNCILASAQPRRLHKTQTLRAIHSFHVC